MKFAHAHICHRKMQDYHEGSLFHGVPHCNPKNPFYPKKMCLGETDN
jgi:hypothetical protein